MVEKKTPLVVRVYITLQFLRFFILLWLFDNQNNEGIFIQEDFIIVTAADGHPSTIIRYSL